MMISKNDLLELFRTENVSDLEVILNAFGLTKDSCIIYGHSQGYLARAILSLASAYTNAMPLNTDFTNEIVARTALCCEVLRMLDLVHLAAPLKFRGVDNAIQPSIRRAVENNDYYDVDIAITIAQLSEPEFLAFVSYLLVNAKDTTLRVGYNLPIIQQIRRYQIISDDLLFSYMALCLRDISDKYQPT